MSGWETNSSTGRRGSGVQAAETRTGGDREALLATKRGDERTVTVSRPWWFVLVLATVALFATSAVFIGLYVDQRGQTAAARRDGPGNGTRTPAPTTPTPSQDVPAYFPIYSEFEDWKILRPDMRVVNFTVTESTWSSLDLYTAGDTNLMAFDMLGDIYLLDLNAPGDGGVHKAIPFATGPQMQTHPRFSPDGKELLYCSDVSGVTNVVRKPLSQRDPLAHGSLVTASIWEPLQEAVWDPQYPAEGHRSVIGLQGRRQFSFEAMSAPVPADGELPRLADMAAMPFGRDPSKPSLGPEELEWSRHQPEFVYFAVNTGGERGFVYNKDAIPGLYSVMRYNVVTKEQELVAGGRGGAVRPHLAPDAKRLAFVRRVFSKTRLVIQDLETGNEHVVPFDLEHDQMQSLPMAGIYPTFSWDSRDSVVVYARGTFWRLNVDTYESAQIRFSADVSQHVAPSARAQQFDLGTGDTFPVKVVLRATVTANHVAYSALGHSYYKNTTAADGVTAPLRLGRTARPEHEFGIACLEDESLCVHALWDNRRLSTLELISSPFEPSTRVHTVLDDRKVVPRGRYAFFALAHGHAADLFHVAYARVPCGPVEGILDCKGAGVYGLIAKLNTESGLVSVVEGPWRIAGVGVPSFDSTGAFVLVQGSGPLATVVSRYAFAAPGGDAAALLLQAQAGGASVVTREQREQTIRAACDAARASLRAELDTNPFSPLHHDPHAAGAVESAAEVAADPAGKALGGGALVDELLISPDYQYAVFVEHRHVWGVNLAELGFDPETQESMRVFGQRKFADGAVVPGLTRLARIGGFHVSFSADGKTVRWLVGSKLFELDWADVAAKCPAAVGRTDGQFDACLTQLTRVRKLGWTVEPAHRDPKPTSSPAAAASVNPNECFAVINAVIWTMQSDTHVIGAAGNGFMVQKAQHIVKLGEGELPAEFACDQKVDAKGALLVPGFIDTHAHWNAGYDRAIFPESNFEFALDLSSGVTTMHNPSIDTIGSYFNSELAQAGLIAAPRLTGTGTILYGLPSAYYVEVNSKQAAREHLERLQEYGSYSAKNYMQFRRASRQMIVEAARELDEPMTIMPEGAMDFTLDLSLVVDGHATMEHAIPMSPLYDDVIELFLQSGTGGTGYTPTLGVAYGGLMGEEYHYDVEEVWKQPALQRWAPQANLWARSVLRPKAPLELYQHHKVAESAAKLIARDGMGLLGAHGQRAGLAFHWEIWDYADTKAVTSQQILRAASSKAAKALGLKELGELREGWLADWVLYKPEAGKLEDIKNHSLAIELVAVDGRVFESATLLQTYPTQRPFPDLPVLDVPGTVLV